MRNVSLNVSSLAHIFFGRFFENWKKISPEDFWDYLSPKLEQALTREELAERLKTRKPLKVKFGIDPTGPDVHLGHLLPIFALRQFQKAGHKVDLIIGDFTAQIGDPSDRNSQRPALSSAQIKKNLSSYTKQIGAYLDIKKIRVHFNSRWLSHISLKEMLEILSQLNVSQILQREDFRNRLEKKHGLSVAEMLYSYIQAMDSVHLKSDVEIGGKDQFLNLAHARVIMGLYRQKAEVALTTPVLEGISGDGRKMSKSYGNYISVGSSYEEKFGRLMSIPDSLIIPYFRAFADIRESELSVFSALVVKNPLEAKKQLAQFFVSIEAKSEGVGKKEREKFEKKFSRDADVKKETSREVEIKRGKTYFDAVWELDIFQSKSEVKRLFSQKGIRMISPVTKTLLPEEIAEEGHIKIGKVHIFLFRLK